jgi:signal peptidase I
VLRKITFAVAVLVILLGSAFQVVVVPTASMERTVLVGDHLLVRRMWIGSVQRGEVVSFTAPHGEEVYLKRVMAIGGDRVELRGESVYVNGQRVWEPYVEHLCHLCAEPSLRRTVPEGEMFVLGDNRDRSEDSRSFGTVPTANVVGKPVMVLWSLAFPSKKWLSESTAVLYFQHPIAHLRWSRLLHAVQ